MVDLEPRSVLARTGDRLGQVYFPIEGAISLVVRLSEGEDIEVAMVGRDSVVGAATALDGHVAMNDLVVQIGGKAAAMDIAQLRIAADLSPTLRTLLIRHEQALFAQTQQSAACGAVHWLESRFARWLLRFRDLAGSNTLRVTQDALAGMLGVQRNSVSVVAHIFRKAGIIRYSRGKIDILDNEALEDSSCECYAAVRDQYRRLLQSD